MQADHVGSPEEVVQFHELRPILRRTGRTAPRGYDELHAEGAGNSAGRSADPAVTDNPHRQSAQFDQRKIPIAEVGAAAPSPLPHRGGVMAHVPGQLQKQGEGHLRHRLGAVCGHVGNDDPALPRGLHVNDVVARGEHADVSQRRQTCDDVAVKDRLVREDDGGFGGPLRHLCGRRPVVNLTVPQRAKRPPVQITGVQRVSVEHDDSHSSRSIPASDRMAAHRHQSENNSRWGKMAKPVRPPRPRPPKALSGIIRKTEDLHETALDTLAKTALYSGRLSQPLLKYEREAVPCVSLSRRWPWRPPRSR